MALHPVVLADLLDREVRQAREELGERAADLRREGSLLLMTISKDGRFWILRLDGGCFDSEPYDVALVDASDAILPLEEWIPGLPLGMHSSLDIPWVCITGTRGYYLHESHFSERWDAVRYSFRAATLIDHILAKVGL
jgi:hypothetical protein